MDTEPEGAVTVHRACGFPVYQDQDGEWRHAQDADDVVCALLFSGGSMLDRLAEEE